MIHIADTKEELTDMEIFMIHLAHISGKLERNGLIYDSFGKKEEL